MKHNRWETTADAKIGQIRDLAQRVHMDDVFVLRHIEDGRFVHIGGAGLGVGWAEIVELHLNECPDACLAHTRKELVQATGRGMRNIFGPYHAQEAFFVPVSHDVLVILGTRTPPFAAPDLDKIWKTASDIADNIYTVSPAKHLADELEELHAIKEILSTRAHSVEQAAQLVVNCITRALTCEFGVLRLREDDHIAIAEHGWQMPCDHTEALATIKDLLKPDSGPICVQDAQKTPLPYPFGPDEGIVSYMLIPITDVAVMLVAHTIRHPRGFSNLCRSLSTNLSNASEVVLMNALHQQQLKKREISLLQSQRESEHANQSKSEFLANMSHELRTPLNAIIGCSEMLKKEIFGPVGSAKNQEYLGIIHDAGTHLHNLIGEILDLSKIEAGAEDLTESTLDVREEINQCLTMVKERAFQKKIHLRARIADDIWGLCADQIKFKQILLNLLSNAIKFTPEGGKVTVNGTLNDTRALTLNVTDTGIGIKAKDIDKVTQPFEQISDVMTAPQEGTGLGLALCKSLMELHGGTLDIASTVGKGTTVTITFPPKRTAFPT